MKIIMKEEAANNTMYLLESDIRVSGLHSSQQFLLVSHHRAMTEKEVMERYARLGYGRFKDGIGIRWALEENYQKKRADIIKNARDTIEVQRQIDERAIAPVGTLPTLWEVHGSDVVTALIKQGGGRFTIVECSRVAWMTIKDAPSFHPAMLNDNIMLRRSMRIRKRYGPSGIKRVTAESEPYKLDAINRAENYRLDLSVFNHPEHNPHVVSVRTNQNKENHL